MERSAAAAPFRSAPTRRGRLSAPRCFRWRSNSVRVERMPRRVLLLLAAAASCFAQSFSFTVSVPQPANHTFHVAMRCDGLAGEFQDFKMPAWMPGYYRILDY